MARSFLTQKSENRTLPAVGGTQDSKIMAKDKPKVFYNCRESSTNQAYFMQNKPNVKIGKMNISIVKIKDYDKEQRTTNNEGYSKQSQTKPILERMNVNFCATGYYKSKPAIRVAGKPNNPNVETSIGGRLVAGTAGRVTVYSWLIPPVSLD